LILGACLKYLKDPEASKDAAADIYLRLLDQLLEHDVRYFRSWLQRVIERHCLTILQKKKRQATIHLDDQELELKLWKLGLFSHLSEEYDRIETDHQIQFAVQELREEQRNCIIGKYFEGKTYKEIAAEFGYEERSIKSYIENGRRNLRMKLSHLKNEE